MKHIQVLVAALLFLISGFSHAHDSLTLRDDGKLIGWLHSKESIWYEFLSPDGYFFFVSGGGLLRAFKIDLIQEIYYTSINCIGTAYIPTSDELPSKLFQIGNPDTVDMWLGLKFGSYRYEGKNSLHNFTAKSKRDYHGNCSDIRDLAVVTGQPVEVIDPARFGFEFSGGAWRLQNPSLAVEQADNIHCNGFESCPGN